nr:hypothetical protein CFP56_24659 [Quercus suber]
MTNAFQTLPHLDRPISPTVSSHLNKRPAVPYTFSFFLLPPSVLACQLHTGGGSFVVADTIILGSFEARPRPKFLQNAKRFLLGTRYVIDLAPLWIKHFAMIFTSSWNMYRRPFTNNFEINVMPSRKYL